MVDTVSQEKRSETMRKVKSSNTTPELLLRKALWKNGIRGWRIHSKDLPGRPDIVFTKKKIAIFVDGCFWHGCPECYRRPNSRQDYWDQKLERNIARDRKNENDLRGAGWKVVRFWEHEIMNKINSCTSKVNEMINISK